MAVAMMQDGHRLVGQDDEIPVEGVSVCVWTFCIHWASALSVPLITVGGGGRNSSCHATPLLTFKEDLHTSGIRKGVNVTTSCHQTMWFISSAETKQFEKEN